MIKKYLKCGRQEIQAGIFQFESNGMTSFMKELKPDGLEDIIAGVALYRPGPMDQIPRYIKNKLNPGKYEYTHPALEPILNVTYGCMIYQEQVMQIVRDLAGYPLARADLVRRAMGKKKFDVMAKERECFINGETDENGKVVINGCVRNGIDEKSANKIFDEMIDFANYAFNKSHAAAYAVIAYQTAYLKTYYKPEFMAATLNSFLGNLDKVPEYIDECKKLKVDILPPSINKSYTKFAVYGDKIRFGLGSVKNVGTAVIDNIVQERKKNGEFKSFVDFLERMAGETVNKKCIESLIKAGAFDDFPETRSTLIASFERIVDTITDTEKKALKGQVTMFDLTEVATTNENIEEIKYSFTNMEEYTEKELLSMEKEILGIYISGHPLDKLRDVIKKQANIDALKMAHIAEENKVEEDGRVVKYAGIITSVKKKYTKNNTIMAFITVEDLYGSVEIIVFDSVYSRSSNILAIENIVLVEGRLSMREEESVKIVANNITSLSTDGKTKEVEESINKIKTLSINITNLGEVEKAKLRGMIKFFSGDNSNFPIQVVDNGETKPCGRIFANDETIKQFIEAMGEDRVEIV